jgi:hypothetical protein
MPANSEIVLNVKQGTPHLEPVEVASADGAIQNRAGGLVFITKASAAALTLAAPQQDGARLTIVSTTAYAHTVTYSAGLGNAGDGKDTITFVAEVGAGLTLVSYNGYWWLVPGSAENVLVA